MRSIVLIFFLAILLASPLMAYENDNPVNDGKVPLSGYIKDASNGEDLIGATVYIEELKSGALTNAYGFYSISLGPGVYHIEYRYVGYETQKMEITLVLDNPQRIDIELNPEDYKLQEIVISGEADDRNVASMDMSVNELDIKTIKKIPTLLGEVDILKSIQLLPGVSTVGEGASGFNVRGGSVGQNLVLLDEAPVYNASHLLGFYSVFNPDAVKDVKLYKGAIPAQYGGRISSILDIRMKDGNNRKFGVEGGIGTIFSRLAVEGPIVKEKGSFVVAGRRSYIDVLAKPFTDVLDNGAQLYFYDLTAKANYVLNQNNRLFLSGYFGKDVFKFDANQGFEWGNTTGTLRWNHLFNDRLFMNTSLIYADYDYSLAFGETQQDFFKWNSRIRTMTFKPELSYFINANIEIKFGGELNYFRFNPANAQGGSLGTVEDISLDKKYGLEYALYLGAEQSIGSKLTLQYGLRASDFRYIGPGNVYTYETTVPGERKELTGIYEAGSGETIANYFNLEPRISFKLQTGLQSSIKASYNRMTQYIHLISNTTASNPLDVWTPSTNNIKPQTADQFTLGYFKNFGSNNDFEFSVEGYYRNTYNQIEYIDGADLLINEFLEADLLSGIGRAYGAEFYLRKNKGRFTGWVSYTLGRTELQVEGINNGAWYPTRYDQLHNLNLAGFYNLTPRWELSANFAWISGTPTTFPTSRFNIANGDYVVPHNAFSSRNNVRIPDYHRLDISATWYGKKTKKNGKDRKNTDYWVFGLYNVYGRRNPFSIYFTQGSDRPVSGQPIPTEAIRVSIIGSIIPAISYNFKF